MADLKSEWEKAAPISEDLASEWDKADDSSKHTIYSKAKMYFNQYGKPLMEMGGMTGGAVVGTKAGALIGTPGGPPGVVIGGLIGGVVGAGLGYGIGKRGSEVVTGEAPNDILESFKESGKDILTGAAYQAGGEVAGKLIFEPIMKGGKWVFDQGKSIFTKQINARIRARAADLWVANTSQGPIYAKNAKEATDIEMAVPGLKFTYGQKTYDPKAIRLERSQIRKPGDAGQLSIEQTASNDEALKAYYQSKFGSETGVDDLLSALQGKQAGLESQTEAAKQTAKGIETGLMPKKEPGQLSEDLIKTLKTEKTHTSQSVSKLYDEIPNVDVSVEGMIDSFKNIAKPTSEVESLANFPKVLRKALKAYGPKEIPKELQEMVSIYSKSGQPLPKELADEIANYVAPKALKFQELRGIRTEILNEARTEVAKNNPEKIRRLRQMQSVVEDTIDQLADTGKYGEDVVTSYRFASKQWKDYADKFKRGTVGNILQGGAKGEVSKLNPEQILGKIFDKGNTQAADQLISAIGKEKAIPIAKEYANYDLMQKSIDPMTGDINRGKLMSWLNRNKPILKKYGMEGDYADIVQAKAIVDDTLKNKVAFEKSQAGKILGADTDKIIAQIFSGKGALNSSQTAKDLMEMVSGNQAATEGLKNAFGEFATLKIQNSLRDIVGNPTASVAKFDALYQKLAPAMRVLYKDSPEKIKALLDMKKAYEIMIRNQRSPFGGGSDTAENVMQVLATLGGPIAQTSRSATAVKAAAKLFARHEASLVDKVINEAIFNPEYANTLRMMATGFPKTMAIAEKRFANHVLSITGLGISQMLTEEQQ